MINVENLHHVGLFVNPIDNTIGSAPCAVTAGQRPEQRLAHPAGAESQSGLAEFKHRHRHGFRQPLGDGATRGRLEPYLVRLTVHVPP